MGIRWPRQVIHQVLKGARQMKDSVVYQEILEEGEEKGMEKGRVTGVRSVLLRLGAKKLGIPDALVHSRLDMINDASTLEELIDRVTDGSFATWAELLASVV
jgi:predicted transposase YdaD